jgi:tRNA(Ile)-lysidine synthetase-like protein
VATLLRPGIPDVNFKAIERLIQFVREARTGSFRIDFTDGLFVLSEAGKLFITDDLNHLPLTEWPQISAGAILQAGRPLALEGDWVLQVEEMNNLEVVEFQQNTDPFQVWLDAGFVSGELQIRGRKTGDRFQPLGMQTGSSKISDLFINEKVPFRARKNWPLVCHADEIIWIPGLRSSQRYRVKGSSQRILHIKLSRH